jgi:uncharacterized protein
MYHDYIVLQVEGISIVGQLFLPGKGTDCRMVCLCHGAPSGAPPEPGDGGYPALAQRFCREGFGSFFFNFRGAGDSGGNMDLTGWTRDLQSVTDYLLGLDNIDQSHLYLVGFSAGAAVSIYTASKDMRIAGVAACACPAEFTPFPPNQNWEALIEHFRSIGAIRDAAFPPSVKEWQENSLRINPVDHITGIAPRPLLLLHGTIDKTVPVEQACRLYEIAGEPKKLVRIEGAGHRLRRDERAVGSILEWLRSV